MTRLALLATGGWVVLLLAAPVLPGWAGAALYGMGAFICHQQADRSFYLAGFQLPVCARCLGLYAGLGAGAAYVWWARADSPALTPRMTARVARRLAAVAAIPTAITVLLEAAGMWLPSNAIRAMAGLPLGAVVGVVVVDALATLHYDGCAPPRPTGPRPPQPPI